MLFKKKKLRIFETSTFSKGVFSFFSLLSILIISIYSLFQINISSLDEIDLKQIAWVFSSLGLIWYGGGILNYNLHISKNDRFVSYLMSIIINGYLIFFIIQNIDNKFTDWKDMTNISYWAMPLFGVDVVWKISISFSEYNARPFFIKKFVARSIINVIAYIIMLLLWYNIEEYLLKGKNYDYLEIKNIIIWFTSSWLFVIAILIHIYIVVKLRKFGVKETSISIKNASWNIFIWLSSVVIWSISNFKSFNWNNEEYILLAIAVFLATTIIMSVVIKHFKHIDRLLFFISTISLFVVSMSSFIIFTLNGLNETGSIIILASFILIFEFSIILVTAKMPKFYMTINAFLSLIVAVIVVLSLIQNKIFGNTNIPIITEAMSASILAISTLLVIILISSQLFIAFGINKNVNRMISVTNNPNKKINMKGAINV